MKIGIVGAGALGLVFAAALGAVADVVVLARRPEVAAALARDGVVIVDADGRERPAAVRATAAAGDFADRDSVICAVKAFATRDALGPLHGVLPAHALVTSIQNGIDFAGDARAVLPDARIAAGSTTQGAVRLAQTRVAQPNRGTTTFERDERDEPSSPALAAAFGAAGLAARVDDAIAAVLWRKLVINVAINPLGALAGRANGAIAEDPDLAALGAELALEAAAVAAAEGIVMTDPWAAVQAAARATATNRNSMLQDLDAGRRTEIDQIAGAIVRRAARHAIAVPHTQTVLRLVRARERSA